MTPVVALLLISEIMYNPASTEQAPVETEWVELYNPTEQTVDLSGWYLQDEDGRTGGAPKGTRLEPGHALVLIPAEQSVADFRKAWGGTDEDYQVVPLEKWGAGGLHNLANSPSDKNEKLTLCRPDTSISDTVNYDDKDPWPLDEPDGASIYLLPDRLTPTLNDEGKSWARSEAGKDLAYHASTPSEYDTKDVGSPGKVMTKKEANEIAQHQEAKQHEGDKADDGDNAAADGRKQGPDDSEK